jgi:hypothetical protein
METSQSFSDLYKLSRAALIQLAHTTGAVGDYTRMLGEAPQLESWAHSDLAYFILEHPEWAVS